jgi:galactoside O-acetyltransferase
MMAAASGNLEFGKTLGEGTAVGAMSLIRRGLQCAPWTVYFGSPARKIANRSKAMLEMEAPLLAEAQVQR